MFWIEKPTSNCRVSKEQQSSRYVVSGRSRIKRTKNTKISKEHAKKQYIQNQLQRWAKSKQS